MASHAKCEHPAKEKSRTPKLTITKVTRRHDTSFYQIENEGERGIESGATGSVGRETCDVRRIYNPPPPPPNALRKLDAISLGRDDLFDNVFLCKTKPGKRMKGRKKKYHNSFVIVYRRSFPLWEPPTPPPHAKTHHEQRRNTYTPCQPANNAPPKSYIHTWGKSITPPPSPTCCYSPPHPPSPPSSFPPPHTQILCSPLVANPCSPSPRPLQHRPP